MFAVPGWSLSADKLKTETVAKSSSGPAAAPSRKRKRVKVPAEDVTKDNVTDLWEQIIENKEKTKGAAPSKPKDSKRQKVKKGDRPPGGAESAPTPNTQSKPDQASPIDGDPAGKSEKKSKKNKINKKYGGKDETAESSPATQPSATTTTAPAAASKPPPPPPKLTPLQASMRAKLISARFRHLNETLYTRPSEEAYRLFDESPEMFAEYHEGFRQQVEVWPENPVDGYIADIRARGAVRPPPSFHGKNGKRPPKRQPPPGPGDLEPLPRTAGTCTVADLGCGDGRLGSELQPLADKLRVQVLSFDLHSPAPHVTKADMANVPLPDGSVNVAVFCLALMGTNWPAFIEEAYRLLHWKGELWVAEIKSRFAPAGARNKRGSAAVVDHSVGKRRKKSAKAGEDDANGQAEALAVEVDGADDRRGETDVSAFVEILTRRGFVLCGNGGDGIDLSNKMFVKMRFIKGAAPTVGKCVTKTPKPLEITGLSRKRGPEIPDAPDVAEEAKALKPCVYKIR
ncbi:hypothetical protein PpBr36_01764 [Pyricularia pennisetigena]|uniref:hypothetical protein n=1 Tax=Pyricularia pennisetigena TaxID=1578925 RepID=UPI00114E30F4|nr:hypothetical protein PpBr36_01764 [Pyricularia pennisetigena]TLS27848.1 hypothetical protein PpBr36_01764 [Pyricularia pennisetigena]